MNNVRSILTVLDAINENTVPKPEREGWWADADSPANDFQGYNQTTYRGKHPFVIVNRGGQVTRIWIPTAKGKQEIKAEYPNSILYKTGTEKSPKPISAPIKKAASLDSNSNLYKTIQKGIDQNKYKNTLDDFIKSDEKGLANNPEAVGAITELNQRLSTLGFSATTSSTKYDIKTVNTVKALQQAYNNMYGDQRLKVDGDLGPNTFKALTDVETLIKKFNSQTTTTESFKSEIARNIINEEVKQLTGRAASELTQTLVALDKFYQSATTNGLTVGPELQQRLINARLSLATHTIDVSKEITPYISTISKGAVERSKEQTRVVPGGGEIKVEPEVVEPEKKPEKKPEVVEPKKKPEVVEPKVVEPKVVEPEKKPVEPEKKPVEPEKKSEVLPFRGGDDIKAMQSDMLVLLSAWSGDQDLFEAKVKEFIELYEESINKNGDDRVRMQAEGLMRRLIQILIGNSRVPDTVQSDNAGKILIRKDKINRSTTKLVRDFRTSLGGPKPEPEPKPETTEETNVFNTKVANKWPVVITITDDNTIEMDMFDGKHQFKNVEFFPPRVFKGSDDRPGKDGTQMYGSNSSVQTQQQYLGSDWDEFFETLAKVDKLVKERTN